MGSRLSVMESVLVLASAQLSLSRCVELTAKPMEMLAWLAVMGSRLLVMGNVLVSNRDNFFR